MAAETASSWAVSSWVEMECGEAGLGLLGTSMRDSAVDEAWLLLLLLEDNDDGGAWMWASSSRRAATREGGMRVAQCRLDSAR